MRCAMLCGRKMVVKCGRFGRFLACPGYPECSFTKAAGRLQMPGKLPQVRQRDSEADQSGNGYTYYACERNKVAPASPDFMTWDVPVKDRLP